MSVIRRYFSSVSRQNTSLCRLFLANIAMVILLLLANGCSQLPANLKVDDNGNYLGILVVYDERESNENNDMFQTEIRILPHRMLISDNRNSSGYLLVDRDKKIIYNVNREDKTIMIIKQEPINSVSPVTIDYKMTSQPSGAIPKVASVKATHYRIDVNGDHCYDVVSAGKDFLPEITQAMLDFRQILASEHAKSVTSIPKDMVNACDLAVNVYNASDYLANGFPFREWDQHGYLRFIRYWRMDSKIKPEMLELPQGYETYSVQ